MKVDALMEGNAHQRTENSRSMRQPFNMYSLEAYQFLLVLNIVERIFFLIILSELLVSGIHT